MGLPVVGLISRGIYAAALAQTLRRAGWACLIQESPEGSSFSGVAAIVLDPEALGQPASVAGASTRSLWGDVPLLVVGDLRLDSAVQALRAGASDYLGRDQGPEEFAAALERALIEGSIRHFASQEKPRDPTRFPELWGDSPAMERLRDRIEQAAASDATAVVLGETGTGKELVARLLHESGPRCRGPFIVVSCSSIPPTLAESELFGHVKGAFSGASHTHRGLIPAAHGGTLFLDDIGALTLDTQAKLLRALQERSVRAVGANEEVSTDFRLVVSSTVRLDTLVRERQFREDLYYRLAVLEIPIPPLRERELDVLALARRFLEISAAQCGKHVVGLTPSVAEALVRHPWPGNVRELKNSIDYAVAVARYDHLGVEDLPETARPPKDKPTVLRDPETQWATAERRHIEAVLRSVNGNRSRAAVLLGIDRKTLHRKLDRFQIDIPARSRSGTRARFVEPVPASDDAQPRRYRFNFR